MTNAGKSFRIFMRLSPSSPRVSFKGEERVSSSPSFYYKPGSNPCALAHFHAVRNNRGEPATRATQLLRFALARQGAVWPSDEPLTSELLETECQHLSGLAVRAALAAGDVPAALQHLPGRPDIVVCSLAEHFLPYGLDQEVCDAIRAASVDDPHGIVETWLKGCGNSARMVR